MVETSREGHVLWGTWEELILVSAVKKHGPASWHLVSAELQSRLPTFSFTPQICKAEYEAIAHRFRCDEDEDEEEEKSRKGGNLSTVPNLFEELRKLRVAQLRRELQHFDNSIGSLKNKIERLQSERERAGTDDMFDGSVLSGVLRTSSSSDPASDCKEETSICTLEPSGNTDPLAFPLKAKAFDVREDVYVCNSSLSKDSVDTPSKADIITGLETKSSSRNITLYMEEKKSMGSVDMPNSGHEVESTKPIQNGLSKSQTNSDQKSMLGSSCRDGSRELKNIGIGESRSDKSESSCLLRVKASPSKSNRNVLYFSSSGDEASTECDDNRLVYRISNKPRSKCKQNVLTKSSDSIEGNQDAFVSKGTSLMKAEVLTLGDSLPKNKCGSYGIGSIVPKTKSIELIRSEDEKRDSSCSDNPQMCEVWGESMEVVDKQLTLSAINGKLYGRKRKFINPMQQNRKETKELVPNHSGSNGGTEAVFKMESVVKAESSLSVCETSAAVGSKDENDVERYSANSRVDKSEMGSFIDGNEDISSMSRKTKREPKVPGKLIPLLECLRTICAHRCAPFFRHSHDYSQGKRRYDLVVRAPINLGMIRGKLEDGHYFESLPFFRDLLLMVNNALVFYPKDSSESAAASGLRECVVKEMNGFFEREALIKQEGPFFRRRNSSEKLARTCQGKRKSLKTSSLMKDSIYNTIDGHVTRNLTTNCLGGLKARGRTGEGKWATENLSKRVSDDQSITKWSGKCMVISEKGSAGDPLSSSRGKNIYGNKEKLTIGPSVKENLTKGPIGSASKNEISGSISSEKLVGSYGNSTKDKETQVGSSCKKKSSSKDKDILIGNLLSQESDNLPKKGAECSVGKVRELPTVPEPVKRIGRPPKHCQTQKEVPINPPRKRIKR